MDCRMDRDFCRRKGFTDEEDIEQNVKDQSGLPRATNRFSAIHGSFVVRSFVIPLIFFASGVHLSLLILTRNACPDKSTSHQLSPPLSLLVEDHELLRSSNERKRYGHCKQFYLDIGSNIGVQVRKLFEPSRYPNAPVIPLFDTYFGTARNRSRKEGNLLCAIGIEMNPHHDVRLKALETHYQSTCGYGFYMLNGTAASTFDGEIDFWSDNKFQYNEWGATTVNGINNEKNGGVSVKVRAMDLAKFILDEIKPFASTVVMKLDIEGSEYKVFPHLLVHGAICEVVDLAFIEIHEGRAASEEQRQNLHNSLSILREAGCKVKLLTLDDESYLHDADSTLNTC